MDINDLIDSRPNIKHEIGLPVDEQILELYPTYFESVVNYIRRLGLQTEQKGHSPELDEMKNTAYKLIGL